MADSTITPLQLVRILQLTDSFFPVGAFAYSDGLETAATTGSVHDGASLKGWLDHFLDSVFVPCDGLALWQCSRAMQNGDHALIRQIDEELTAIRPSAAVRASSRSIGKRMLTAYAGIVSVGESARNFETLAESMPCSNAPVAYALVMSHRGVAPRDALLAFGYGRVAGIVSAALRLISIGQNQAQTLLSETIERLPDCVARIEGMELEPIRSFSPAMDIVQMNHRYVYSRLFRS